MTPVATIAAPASTTVTLDNPPNPLLVKIAAPASTTIKLDNPLNPSPVKIAAPASTTAKSDNPHVKIAALADTAMKQTVFPTPCVKVVQMASTMINLARAIVYFARTANTPRNLPPHPSLNATHVNRGVL